ncbi:MAG: hypothetical protein ACR2NC_03065 [Thermodesulfobacteriota bacterium]
MKKDKKDEIKIRKPVPKKANQVIKSKKDKEKKKRPKHKDLVEEIDN